MLDRVALQQTRLRLPGLGVDSKGVALGSRGMVLLAALDRLVAFLALYTSSHSMADVLPSLRIEVVQSRMGTREIVLSFAADGTERMDRFSEVARATLGHTFVGSNRHFVQYRDASAPFGYDVPELLSVEGDYVLYHNAFSQAYKIDRVFDLRGLILRLQLAHDPPFGRDPHPCLVLAEEGLGPAVIQYLLRSQVDARFGVAESPPASAFDDSNVRSYLFDVPSLPPRMAPLLRDTPGLRMFRVVAPGVAIQHGFRHPISLASCPVFPSDGMVFFRGNQSEPLVFEKLPTMGSVTAFARVSFHAQPDAPSQSTTPILMKPVAVPPVTIPVRLLPATEHTGKICATFVPPSDYSLLRQLLYLVGAQTMRTATIAFVEHGAFLLTPSGVESTPVGCFLRELRPGLFCASGYDMVPAIDAEVLFRALGSPSDQHVFLLPNERAVGVPKRAFVALQTALVQSHAWAPTEANPLTSELSTAPPTMVFDKPDCQNHEV